MTKYWFDYEINLIEAVYIEADSLEKAKEKLEETQEDIGIIHTFYELSSGNWEILGCSYEANVDEGD